MTANTGRTVPKHTLFLIDDSGGTLRQIAINSLSALGVTYEPSDLTAFQDAVTGALPGHPSAPIEIGGPVDTTADTGSHTVLNAINGLAVPLSLDVRMGVRQAWEAGEPQFGLTSTATSGYLCVSYLIDTTSMLYTASLVLFPGSDLPAFGVAAES